MRLLFSAGLIAVVAGTFASGADRLGAPDASAHDLTTMIAFAATSPPRAPAQAAPANPGIDVVLVLDCSGSTFRPTADGPATDPLPDPLRIEMVRLAVALAGVDTSGALDRLAVICFGTAASRDHRMALTPVLDEGGRRSFVALAERKVVDRGGTNYVDALSATVEVLEEGDAAYRAAPFSVAGRSLLLLFASDGRPQMDNPGIDRDQLRVLGGPGGLYDRFREHGWPIYTVGFGPAAVPGDHADVLKQMSVRSGGRYFPAASRDDLLSIYTALLSSTVSGSPIAAPRPPVRLPVIQFFELAPGLLQATVTVVGGSDDTRLTVVRPDERVLSAADVDVSFTTTSRFRAVTIRNPEPAGLWKALIDGQGTVMVEVVARPRPASSPEPVAPALPTAVAVATP